MRYMLMMHTPRGTGDYQINNWSPEDFKAHIAFMVQLNQDLTEAGELVGCEGLAPPGQTKVVRAGRNGAPAVTDGPFAEAKEFLAGYWIVEVDRPERAYEIAAKASAAPGPGGKPLIIPIEVRQVMSAPPTTGEVTPKSADATVGHLLRELAPQVLGALARRHHDFAAAEDAVQEALIAAARQWPVAGLPDNPRGWLYRVAVRRLTDHVRSETARRRREDAVASQMPPGETVVPPPDDDIGPDRDDTLVLLFMCCHPALTPPSAIALTLRAVGGLTTAEIANAFLVPEATMAQRISRAKGSIKASGVPFELPGGGERAARLGAVLHVLYLMFSEGYTSSIGPALHRADLSSEAIRLTRAMHSLLPNDGEVAGLLALMLLTDARRAARTGASGELIPLDEQDRTLWDQGPIAEGTALLMGALSRGAVGYYQIQAAIAAIHDEAPRAEETDWPQILAFYNLLKQMSDNPMVVLNHAIAATMVHGPVTGLELLKPLDADPRMAGHYRLDAVRAHLLEKAGDPERALAHYQAAADRTTSIPERNYLITRAARLAAGQRGTD